MFRSYKITVDDKNFRKELGEFKHKMPVVARRMMSKVAQGIRKTTRQQNLRGGLLQKRSGTLYKSLTYKSKNDFTLYITAGAHYATTHEKGAVIEAKDSKYLTFQIGDEWKKVKSVTIPQRQFLWPVISEYFTTRKAESIMDAELQRQLEKFISKSKGN